MSRQARKRRRAHQRAGPARVLLIGAVMLAIALLVGVIAAVAYVVSVKNSAPALASLRPVLPGASSPVFAADGTQIAIFPNRELAMVTVRHHDLEPLSVH